MSNHNHDHGQEPTAKLTDADRAYSRISAQLALAMIREDRDYFRQVFDDATQYLTIGQIIEAQAIELAAVVLQTHGTVDAADRALVATLQKVATGDL